MVNPMGRAAIRAVEKKKTNQKEKAEVRARAKATEKELDILCLEPEDLFLTEDPHRKITY